MIFLLDGGPYHIESSLLIFTSNHWTGFYMTQTSPKKVLNNPKIYPFQANVPFLYPLKTSENVWFSDFFSEYKNGTLS